MRHYGVAYCGDAFQEVEGVGGGGAGEGLDEDYAGRGLRAWSVEALDTDWHCGERAQVSVTDRVYGNMQKLILNFDQVEVSRRWGVS